MNTETKSTCSPQGSDLISGPALHHSTTIHNLPGELLEEIALFLDFDGVLCLRETSRRLRDATEARSIWLALAAKYRARYYHIPRPAIGTIDEMGTEELREWVYTRLAFENLWKRPTLLHPRKNFIPINFPGSPTDYFLLPGGRWLIYLHSMTHFGFVDLDCDNPTPTSLVTPSEKVVKESREMNRVKWFVSQSGPTLELYLAVCPAREKGHSGIVGWFRIYKVTITGQGKTVRPTEQSTTYIPCLFIHALIIDISIGNNVAVRSARVADGINWIEALRWRECTSTTLTLSIFRLPPENGGKHQVSLVGDDYILVRCIKCFSLFHIPPYQQIAIDWDPNRSCEMDRPLLNPIWVYNLKGTSLPIRLHPSPWMFDGEGYQMVLNKMDVLVGITIFSSPEITPVIRFKISPNPVDPWQYIGIFKSCFFRHDGYMIRVTLVGDDDEVGCCTCDLNSAPRKRTSLPFASEIPPDYNIIPLFDEETGRCVIRAREGINVGDFISCV